MERRLKAESPSRKLLHQPGREGGWRWTVRGQGRGPWEDEAHAGRPWGGVDKTWRMGVGRERRMESTSEPGP